MRAIGILVAVLMLTACGNPELKAEQEAWKRLVDHAQASKAAEDACMAAAGADSLKAKERALWAKYEEASAASKRASEAHLSVADDYLRAMRTSYGSNETARLKVVHNNALSEANRATEATSAALKENIAASTEWTAVVERCSKEAGSEPEMSIRIAEYKAACAKCAVAERCEANFESNYKAVEGKPYDASLYTFACRKK